MCSACIYLDQKRAAICLSERGSIKRSVIYKSSCALLNSMMMDERSLVRLPHIFKRCRFRDARRGKVPGTLRLSMTCGGASDGAAKHHSRTSKRATKFRLNNEPAK